MVRGEMPLEPRVGVFSTKSVEAQQVPGYLGLNDYHLLIFTGWGDLS